MTDTTDQQAVTVAEEGRNSIYAIERGSPSFTWPEREAVTEDAIDAALGAYVPGGARVYCWLPMADGHTIHQTARDVMRAAIAGLDKHRLASVSSASAEEAAHLQTIDERDALHDALSDAYRAVCGKEPEWSNLFGYNDALDDIRESVAYPEPVPATRWHYAGSYDVEQVDREAAWHHAVTTGRVADLPSYKYAFQIGEWDHTEDVQAFARHRLAERERCAGVATSMRGWNELKIATAIRETPNAE